jgi:hypothetical protein
MSAPSCDARWLPGGEERWQAHLGCDEHFNEPGEVVFYCPNCPKREFGDD